MIDFFFKRNVLSEHHYISCSQLENVFPLFFVLLLFVLLHSHNVNTLLNVVEVLVKYSKIRQRVYAAEVFSIRTSSLYCMYCELYFPFGTKYNQISLLYSQQS